MQYKVKEVADMVGISVRMLHHYDKIGLLKPASVSPAGYRLYSDNDLERLQQVLLFKELDFTLKQIKEILDTEGFDREKALESHRHLIIQKQKRLNRIIKTLDKTIDHIKGESIMSKKEMFDGFDMSEIEQCKEKYAKEVKDLYGNSNAYKESKKKTSKYTKDYWKEIQSRGEVIFKRLAELMDKDPADGEVQDTIEQYRQYITESFYTCTPEIFRGLGEMYVCDPRFTKNIDKFGEGLSEFMKEAMGIYCDNL